MNDPRLMVAQEPEQGATLGHALLDAAILIVPDPLRCTFLGAYDQAALADAAVRAQLQEIFA